MLLATLTSIGVLAIAVSLDSIGVGITYGIRKIKIPLLSVIIIACCSGAIIALSMQAGVWLSNFLSAAVAGTIGALILVLIGFWALYQSYRGVSNQKDDERELLMGDNKGKEARISQANPVSSQHQQPTTAQLFTIEFKRIGLVIQILRKPQTADFDHSGTISATEAIMLGIALSLDALGAGLAAAMLGLHVVYTPFFIAGCSALFLIAGTYIGRKLSEIKWVQYISCLPGVMLILLGIFKLF